MRIVRLCLLAGLLVVASPGCAPSSPGAHDMRALCAAARTAIDVQDVALLTMDAAAWGQAADAVGLVVAESEATGSAALTVIARQWQEAMAAAGAAPDRAEAFGHLTADPPGPAFRVVAACEMSGIAMLGDELSPVPEDSRLPWWVGATAWLALVAAATAAFGIRRRRPDLHLLRGTLTGLAIGTLAVLVIGLAGTVWLADAGRDVFGWSPSPWRSALLALTDPETPAVALLSGGLAGAVAGLAVSLWRGHKDPTRANRDER